MLHELMSRDHEDERATGQPQGVGAEAYLNGTSQGELVLSLSKEHPRTPGRTVYPGSQQSIHETFGLDQDWP